MNLSQVFDQIKNFTGAGAFNIFAQVLKAILIITASFILVKLGSFVIRKAVERQKKFRFRPDVKKLDTLSSLMVSIFKYMVYIIAIVAILADTFNLKSVLAAAGVGGIAIGFGAQSLIKDIISGFFIVLEDQFVVGDLVTIDTMTGTVEDLELRVTRVRNFNGDLYIIPNGEIKKVTNHTRGNQAVIVDLPLSYSTSVGKAFEAATRACERAAAEFSTITESPVVQGIIEMSREGMTMRIFARTLPNEQWDVERRLRVLVKEEFDREGIGFYSEKKIILAGKAPEGGEGDG